MKRALSLILISTFALYWAFSRHADRAHKQPRPAPQQASAKSTTLKPEPSKPAAVTAEPASPDRSIHNWMAHESKRLGHADDNPAATQKRLRSRALRLTPAEILTLKEMALDEGAEGDERFLAVHMLALASDSSSLEALKEIGSANTQPAPNDRAQSDQVLIRMRALEALAQRLPANEAHRFLHELLARTPDPTLARHAQYLLSHPES